MEVLIKSSLFEGNDSTYLLPQVTLTSEYLGVQTDSYIDSEISIGGSSKVKEFDTNQDEKIEQHEYHVAAENLAEQPFDIELSNEQHLEELRHISQQDGYKMGYAEGLTEVKGNYKAQCDRMDLLLTTINDALPNYLENNKVVIASIVFESVCKIVGKILAENSNSLNVVKHTILSIDKEEIQEIYINENDLNVIEKLKADLASDNFMQKSDIDQFKFKLDSNIKYGGCKIKLIDGYLDASIERQLKMLSNSLIKKTVEFALK